MTPSLEPKTAAEVPSIKYLRQELNYADTLLPQTEAFQDDVRAFRKKFITRQGLSGSSLHDWKSQDHQNGLIEMTQAYLERYENGLIFWPDEEGSPRYNSLQYSKHHERIKFLMRQLFFRLNLQQCRNSKYRNKDKSGDANKADRGSTPQNPIDLDVAGDDIVAIPTTEHGASPGCIAYTSFGFRCRTSSNANSVEAPIPVFGSDSTGTNDCRRDPYEVSESPDLGAPFPSNQNLFSVMTPETARPSHRSAHDANEAPPAKRARRQNGPTFGRFAAYQRPGRGVDGSRRGRKSSRLSARQRKLRRDPAYASLEEIDAALESPEPNPSPNQANTDGTDATPNQGASDKEPANTSETAPCLQSPTVGDTVERSSVDTLVNDIVRHVDPTPAGTGPGPLQTGGNGMLPSDTAANTTSSALSPDLPVPAETSGVASAEPSAALNTPQMPPTRKAKVEFRYRVVFHSPLMQVVEWDPKGNFRRMSLSELESELPVPLAVDFKGLRFRVFGPGIEHIVQTVDRGREIHFVLAKRYIESVICKCISQSADGRPVIEIEIEALGDEEPGEESTSKWDFDW